jgi:hypothetical protein
MATMTVVQSETAYHRWLNRVDESLFVGAGIDHRDFAGVDVDFHDLHEAGLAPHTAATFAISAAVRCSPDLFVEAGTMH